MKKTLLILVLSSPVLSETLILNPTKDNTLYETDFADTSNALGEYSFIGRTGNNASAKLRRAVYQFDASGIAANSTINSVFVSFTISKVPPKASSGSANLHLMLTDWGEGTSLAEGSQGSGINATINDPTWMHSFFDQQVWNTPGGDFKPESSAVASYGIMNGESIDFISNTDLIADVQLWVNAPANNFGWIVTGDEITVRNSRRLNTSENTSGVPVLTIDYTPPADAIFLDGFE